jgi:hypothetical protein
MHPSKSKCWYPFESYLSIIQTVHRNDLSDIVHPHGEECEGEARSLVYTVKLHFPDAGYADRLGPWGKHFLTVNVLHLFMAPPPPPNCQIQTSNYVLMFYLYVNNM